MQDKEIKKLVSTYTGLSNKLKKIEPMFEWSNLIGDYGEYIAINNKDYNLKKAPTGQKGYDAVYKEGYYKGKKVQIKTVFKTKSVNFSSKADHLLVIQVDDKGGWKEIYFQDLEKVRKESSVTNNRYTINISKLIKIAKGTLPRKELIIVNLKTGKTLTAKTRRELRQKLINKGYSVPSESTINRRINYFDWELERAFGIKVPPNYSDVEHYVDSKGYKWFPKKPTVDKNRKPVVHHPEKRVYVSQEHFAEDKGIAKEYVSEKIKKDWDTSRIIESYGN